MLKMLYKQQYYEKAKSRKEEDLFEIALTFFCFSNKDLLKILDERGNYIREGNIEGMVKKGKEL